MTDLRDKIAKCIMDGVYPIAMADAIVEIVETQHAADLEAVREACKNAIVEPISAYVHDTLYKMRFPATSHSHQKTYEAAHAAMEDLDLSQITSTTPYVPKADLEAAQDEIARLREVLNEIDGLDPEERATGCSVSALAGLVNLIGRKARAALAKKGGK